ncbi:tetratricopeptide repeat-containing sensor histidine kinase [Gilvibacter sp.]|uniref:tetratricopeptide repeat-containing sensor histidine kinase n=1 Tax=Gilvibacter sp. TaxID=2729997 RepID=UPI003F4A4DCB
MRFVLLLTALLVSNFSYSQSQERELVSLKAKIFLAQDGEKLELMDSLTELVKDQMELSYDSIARATTQFALQLDSTELATYTAARLVWSWANRNGAPAKAVDYFQEFIQNDINKASGSAKARLYLNGGDGYYFSGQVEKSIEVYQEAAAFALTDNNGLLAAIAKKYTADAFTRMGQLAEGANMLNEVEEIYRSLNDTLRLVNAQSSRADLYSMAGFFDLAEKQRRQAIETAEKINYLPGQVAALYNAATDHSKVKNYAASIADLKRGLKLVEGSELYDQYEPAFKLKLIQMYADTDSLKLAEDLFNEVQNNVSRYTQGRFQQAYNRSLAELRYIQGRYPEALSAAKENLENLKGSQTLENVMGAHDVLSNIYESMGNSAKALFHFQAFEKLEDSLLGIQQRQALTYYQTLYETEKRDAQIAAQESEINLLDAESKRKSQVLIFGGLILLGIFTIIYLASTREFAKKKQKMQRLFARGLIQNQEEERTRVARDLHDGVGQKLMLLAKKINESATGDTANLAKNTLEELRGISRGLHPSTLRRLGLKAAIESMVNEIDKNCVILLSHEIAEINGILSPENELHLYRIIQESLNNIVKHSGAGSGEVSLKKTSSLMVLHIKDNGNGFQRKRKN